MKSDSEFQSFYQSALVPILTTLDGDRKKIVRSMRPFLVLFIIFLIATIAGFAISSNMNTDVYSGDTSTVQFFVKVTMVATGCMFITLGLYGLFYFFSFSKKIAELKHRFKGDVISKMVKFADESLQYDSHRGISQGEYKQSHIFPEKFDRYGSEDMVSGKLGSTAIRFSEVHAEYKIERHDGKTKSTEWKTIFKGILFAADFNKKFIGRTVVLEDIAENFFGSLGTMFQKMNMARDPLIKLEDVEFEKAFAVYGTDSVEAHYILSPSLMRRILDFKKKSGIINLSFIDSHVYIAIPVRENLFEPRVYSTLINYDRMVGYNKYLMLVTGIVEDLNLNTRIWTKE